MVATPLKARWIYLRGLGLCFFATFVSLLLQARGLIGERGLYPVAERFSGKTFFQVPTLYWLNGSDGFLLAVLAAGTAGAVLVMANRWNRIGLFLCWLCFLSFAAVSPQFTWYKADSLLLEAAFLGLFLAPGGARPGWGEKDPPTRIALAAHLWLLFRLMLETGLSKAFSPDPAWKDLSAMAYFHDNMPFPTWIGWLFGRLPYVFQRAETLFTLVVELVGPFLLLMGKRARFAAVLAWCLLQVGIILSGNFLAFNYQSLALGLLFVGYSFSDLEWSPGREARRALVLVPHMVLGFLLLLSFPFYPNLKLPAPADVVLKEVAPFRSVNYYILYPFIEKERRVIIVEGSNDGGATWREYGYQWQPQAIDRAPRFLAPLSDRFEREMQRILERPGNLSYRENDFFLRVARGLIDDSKPVVSLFAENPFEGTAPDRVRSAIYRFEAADLRTLLNSWRWWTRKKVGYFSPEIARDPATGRIDYVDTH